jgi:hypothetical protein
VTSGFADLHWEASSATVGVTSLSRPPSLSLPMPEESRPSPLAGGAGTNRAPLAAPQSRSGPGSVGLLNELPRRGAMAGASRGASGVARRHWLDSSAADGANSLRLAAARGFSTHTQTDARINAMIEE